MSENHKAVVKENICATMNLIYTLSTVLKTCTHLADDQDVVRQTALSAASTIMYLASDLCENVTRVYGNDAE